jgi:hypothetical protein
MRSVICDVETVFFIIWMIFALYIVNKVTNV